MYLALALFHHSLVFPTGSSSTSSCSWLSSFNLSPFNLFPLASRQWYYPTAPKQAPSLFHLNLTSVLLLLLLSLVGWSSALSGLLGTSLVGGGNINFYLGSNTTFVDMMLTLRESPTYETSLTDDEARRGEAGAEDIPKTAMGSTYPPLPN